MNTDCPGLACVGQVLCRLCSVSLDADSDCRLCKDKVKASLPETRRKLILELMYWNVRVLTRANSKGVS